MPSSAGRHDYAHLSLQVFAPRDRKAVALSLALNLLKGKASRGQAPQGALQPAAADEGTAECPRACLAGWDQSLSPSSDERAALAQAVQPSSPRRAAGDALRPRQRLTLRSDYRGTADRGERPRRSKSPSGAPAAHSSAPHGLGRAPAAGCDLQQPAAGLQQRHHRHNAYGGHQQLHRHASNDPAETNTVAEDALAGATPASGVPEGLGPASAGKAGHPHPQDHFLQLRGSIFRLIQHGHRLPSLASMDTADRARVVQRLVAQLAGGSKAQHGAAAAQPPPGQGASLQAMAANGKAVSALQAAAQEARLAALPDLQWSPLPAVSPRQTLRGHGPAAHAQPPDITHLQLPVAQAGPSCSELDRLTPVGQARSGRAAMDPTALPMLEVSAQAALPAAVRFADPQSQRFMDPDCMEVAWQGVNEGACWQHDVLLGAAEGFHILLCSCTCCSLQMCRLRASCMCRLHLPPWASYKPPKPAVSIPGMGLIQRLPADSGSLDSLGFDLSPGLCHLARTAAAPDQQRHQYVGSLMASLQKADGLHGDGSAVVMSPEAGTRPQVPISPSRAGLSPGSGTLPVEAQLQQRGPWEALGSPQRHDSTLLSSLREQASPSFGSGCSSPLLACLTNSVDRRHLQQRGPWDALESPQRHDSTLLSSLREQASPSLGSGCSSPLVACQTTSIGRDPFQTPQPSMGALTLPGSAFGMTKGAASHNAHRLRVGLDSPQAGTAVERSMQRPGRAGFSNSLLDSEAAVAWPSGPVLPPMQSLSPVHSLAPLDSSGGRYNLMH